MDKKTFSLRKRLSDEEESDIRSKLFIYITFLLGARNQLRMNHWQTTSYEEHITTDNFISSLDSFVDKLAESAIGIVSRPEIGLVANTITDLKNAPSLSIVQEIKKQNIDMLDLFDDERFEGINVIIGDFDSQVNTTLYLLTLN